MESVSFDTLLFLVYGCSGQPNGIVTRNKVDENHSKFHLKGPTNKNMCTIYLNITKQYITVLAK